MNDLEFSFEISALEEYADGLQPGESVFAGNFLAMAEGEPEEAVTDALALMEQRGIRLDLSDLPAARGTGEAALRLRREAQMVAEGLRIRDLDPGDPLRLYLEEVAMTPAAGDEQLLAEKCAAGDNRSMEMLTNLGLGRVIDIAKHYAGLGVLLLDLIQEGSLGLWQAIGDFRGGDYMAASNRRIHFCMARAVLLQARSNGVGQKMRAALEDYRSVDEKLLAELGRTPTLSEMAQGLHLSEEAVQTVRKMLDNARILAQAKKEPEPEEAQEAQEQAVEDTAYFQMRQRIRDLLAELDPQDAQLLTLRYGLEGGLPMTAEETGARLGLTAAQVVAREAAALTKLRNH